MSAKAVLQSSHRRLLILAFAAIAGLCAPTTLHATPLSYTFNLTPTAGSTYGGSGSFTITSAPGAGDVKFYDGVGLTALSFSIDGQTFDLSGVANAAVANTFVELLNGSLRSINFAETLVSGGSRFTLDTTGQYAFYYNNGQAVSNGTFTNFAAVASAPEPSSLLLLGTGLLGLVGAGRRKFRMVGSR